MWFLIMVFQISTSILLGLYDISHNVLIGFCLSLALALLSPMNKTSLTFSRRGRYNE